MTRADDPPADEPIVAVILAGGLSRRMGGGDKCLRLLGGVPILTRILDRLTPQCDAIVINANGDPGRFAGFSRPVIEDVIAGHPGPLAGILSGMVWARAHHPRATWLVSVASDAPFFPTDLVDRLHAGARAAHLPLACAASLGQSHPVFGLWQIGLEPDLRHAITADGVRKVDLWTAWHGCAVVNFAVDAVDPFFNANRPEDLAEAERLLARVRQRPGMGPIVNGS